MTESEGRQWLKRKLLRFDLQFQAIESGGTGVGIPDVYIRHNRGSLWLELKIGHYVSHAVRVIFRPGQLAWIQKNTHLGGRTAMMMFVPHEEGNDFAWWVFRGAEIKPMYKLDDLGTVGRGFLTGNTDPALVLDALFDNH